MNTLHATNPSRRSPAILTPRSALPLCGAVAILAFAPVAWAGGPKAVVTPAALDFGKLPIGATSPPLTVTLANTGDSPMTVSGVAVTGVNPSDFALVNAPVLPLVMPPGNMVMFSVTFTPTLDNVESASFDLATHAPNPTTSVMLSGFGRRIGVALSPESGLHFGTVALGHPSTPQNALLSNTGDADAHVAAVTIKGDGAAAFSVTGAPATPLGPMASVMLPVVFTPPTEGAFAAMLEVDSMDPGVAPLMIPLDGAGGAGMVTIAPTMLDFASVYIGTSAVPQRITLTNPGSGPVVVDRLTTDDAQFGPSKSGLDLTIPPASMAPANTITLPIAFAPIAEGEFHSTLGIALAGQPQPIATFTAKGSGVPHPPLIVAGCGCALGGTPPARAPLAAVLLILFLVGRSARRRV